MSVYVHGTAGQSFPTRDAAVRAADELAGRGVTPRPVVTHRRHTIPRRASAMRSTFHRYALAGADHYASERDARTYVAARERGETPTVAHRRVLVERACREVLTELYGETGPYGDPLATYAVDPAALARWTATGVGMGRAYMPDGTPVYPAVHLPDGATARVYVYRDDDARPTDECHGFDAVEAWHADQWSYVGVSVVVELADGRQGQADLWGVESGDYWPGSHEADIWHAVDIIGEAAANALDTPTRDPRRETVRAATDADALDRIAEACRRYADPANDDADPLDVVAAIVAETGREVTP